MLSNPPYGKSWKSDLERMGGKTGIKDPRFIIEHAGDPEYSLVTRSSDGQMLFLANMLSKMKHSTPLGSRIAEVHNGSSLFTGDAGQGESNIRRWIIENDWLEAIVALPLNMFYNTGIATYIWVLTNRKPAHRKGKVQLIDATQWFKPLRKNLGKKNCELSDDDITTHLRHLPRLQGDRAVEDLPQRGLRLLGRSRSSARCVSEASTPSGPTPPRRSRRSRPSIEVDRDRAAGHQEDPQDPARCSQIRCAACSRPRSTAGTAWSSTSPTATCATPSRCRCSKTAASRPSYAARCCPTRPTPGIDRVQRQDRLRDQLHPLLLQAPAAAHARGDPRRHPGAGEGDRGAARRDHRGGRAVSGSEALDILKQYLAYK